MAAATMKVLASTTPKPLTKALQTVSIPLLPRLRNLRPASHPRKAPSHPRKAPATARVLTVVPSNQRRCGRKEHVVRIVR